MATLLERNKQIRCSVTRRPLNRLQALELERRTIERLLRKGFHLTNWQQNPFRHQDDRKAGREILARRMRARLSK
jgi:hypothetical protein